MSGEWWRPDPAPKWQADADVPFVQIPGIRISGIRHSELVTFCLSRVSVRDSEKSLFVTGVRNSDEIENDMNEWFDWLNDLNDKFLYFVYYLIFGNDLIDWMIWMINFFILYTVFLNTFLLEWNREWYEWMIWLIEWFEW